MLDALYLAAVEPGAWSAFLNAAARQFDACVAAFISRDPGRTRYTVAESIGLSGEAIRLYNEHYAAVDPWSVAFRDRGACEWIGLGSDLCSPEALGNSEFYSDYLKKHTASWYQAGTIHEFAGGSSVFTLHSSRRQRDFSEADIRMLHGLFPHLRRALNVHRNVVDLKICVAQVAGAVDALDVGLIGLGQDRKVRFTNASADALLHRDDVLVAKNGHLMVRDSQVQSSLDRLLTSAFSRSLSTPAGGVIKVSSPTRELVVTVLPANRYRSIVSDQSTILVLIVDMAARPRSRSRLLSALFGLTPAETRLVMALLEGLDTNEIALRRQTTPDTVRFQLKAIYRKTGVARQSQLVRLVSRIPGFLEADPFVYSSRTFAGPSGPRRPC